MVECGSEGRTIDDPLLHSVRSRTFNAPEVVRLGSPLSRRAYPASVAARHCVPKASAFRASPDAKRNGYVPQDPRFLNNTRRKVFQVRLFECLVVASASGLEDETRDTESGEEEIAQCAVVPADKSTLIQARISPAMSAESI